MAKKKIKRKPAKAKSKKPSEKRDFAQNALSIVERLIGGKLATPKKKSGR